MNQNNRLFQRPFQQPHNLELQASRNWNIPICFMCSTQKVIKGHGTLQAVGGSTCWVALVRFPAMSLITMIMVLVDRMMS